MKAKNYRYIYLPSGDYLQIKFDEEGIVYDRFNEDDEHQESYGYDFYNDIDNVIINILMIKQL